MKKLDYAFCALACLLLVLVVITATRESHPPWAQYQQRYKEGLVLLAGVSADAAAQVPVKVQQDWLPEFERTDRCRTCHISIQDPAFAEAAQPLTTHPETHHQDFENLGCTLCHEGQGRALDVEQAHGHAENWEYPLLPRGFEEGSCGRCHLASEVPEAPNLTQGRRLIERYQCSGCHVFGDFEPDTRLGLDLDGLGSKVSSGWLAAWLKRPREYLPQTRMPNFRLEEDEITAIGAYLLSSRQPSIDAFELPAVSEDEEEALFDLGKKLFSGLRCVTCHQVEGRGGTMGPDVSLIGDKVSLKWLYLWLTDPAKYQPNTAMPTFSFPDRDTRALAEFLHVEYASGEEYQPAPRMEEPDPALIKQGKLLSKKYGCYGCHILPGNLKGPDAGPDLSEIASKPLNKIDFGSSGIEQNLANFLFVKLQAPRIFGKDTKMPDFEATIDEIAPITTALLSQTRRGIVATHWKKKIRKGEEFDPQGEIGQLFAEYRCVSCHSFFGQGGTLAPDLTYVGSQLRPEYIEQYLMTPDTVRPFLAERMPVLGIGREKARLFADYARMVLRSDRVPEMAAPADSASIEEGRQAFERHNCVSCHIIDGKGGYYGPILDRAGTRLQPGWIYARILDPTAHDPKTPEPRLGVSPEEAKNLAAYLSTKKQIR